MEFERKQASVLIRAQRRLCLRRRLVPDSPRALRRGRRLRQAGFVEPQPRHRSTHSECRRRRMSRAEPRVLDSQRLTRHRR